MIYAITDKTFEIETASGLVLIDFWAPWCGPCKVQGPILEDLSQEINESELKICKIDVDENIETASKFGILSIPTLMIKKDGQIVKQVAGVHSKTQLKSLISQFDKG